jgi:predicted dehydrogenase
MAIVEVYGNEHLRPLYSHLPLSKQQFPQEYFELDLMIRRLRIDCVIISAEPFAHKSYGLRALEKGLNVITDKL